MNKLWDSGFEALLRATIDIPEDMELDPGRPLLLYGLSSTGYLSLAVALADSYDIPVRSFVQRAFSTAATLWEFVTSDHEVKATVATTFQRLSQRPSGRTLAHSFAISAFDNPDAPCLIDMGMTVSYAQVDHDARALATLLRAELGKAPGRVAVLGERAIPLYRAYLAVLYAGATVVPLSLTSPPARNAGIVTQADVRAVVVTGPADDQVAAITSAWPDAVLIDGTVVPDEVDDGLPDEITADDDFAYLLFTSGSTGRPKGVGITHDNVGAFLSASLPRYVIGPGDVFTQCHELTFDLSVFELWGAWVSGSALLCVPLVQALDPARTTAAHGVTVWTSTPSLMETASSAGRLPPGSMSGLRYVVFCGEPLLAQTAAAVRAAAPQATVDNTYGPTEATVWCTYHRLTRIPGEGVVSIGTPCPGTEVLILEGELCVTGPQLFGGYLDPALNEGKFVDTEGKRWYRTGDLVYRDGAERLHHRGRTDDQVKIRGYRVELGEVEASASRALDGRRVAALLAGDELVVFVEGEPVETEDLRQVMSGTVPKYMVPSRVFTVERFELTRNAKLDKAKLLALAQDPVGA